MKRFKKIMRIWGIPIACGLIVVLIFQFVLLIGYVPSSSMEPTIRKGNYIVGQRIHGELRRGDIVIFRLDEKILVKRIAAVPGDIVYIKDAVVQVNCTLKGAERILEIPEGCFFMLGDNSADSFDARYWDIPFIREDDILAKMFIR